MVSPRALSPLSAFEPSSGHLVPGGFSLPTACGLGHLLTIGSTSQKLLGEIHPVVILHSTPDPPVPELRGNPFACNTKRPSRERFLKSAARQGLQHRPALASAAIVKLMMIVVPLTASLTRPRAERRAQLAPVTKRLPSHFGRDSQRNSDRTARRPHRPLRNIVRFYWLVLLRWTSFLALTLSGCRHRGHSNVRRS
jgi:hypothetical protein